MAQVDVLEAKLDALIDSFREFKDEYSAGKESNIKEHTAILNALNGNGKPGIKQEVLENTIFRKNAQKAFWALTAGFITLLGGLVITVIKIW